MDRSFRIPSHEKTQTDLSFRSVWVLALFANLLPPHMNSFRPVWEYQTMLAFLPLIEQLWLFCGRYWHWFIAFRSSWVTLNEIFIVLIAKGTPGMSITRALKSHFAPKWKIFLLTWKFQVDLKTQTDLRKRNEFQVDLSFISPVSCERAKGFDRRAKWVSNRSETQTGLSLLMWGHSYLNIQYVLILVKIWNFWKIALRHSSQKRVVLFKTVCERRIHSSMCNRRNHTQWIPAANVVKSIYTKYLSCSRFKTE